MNFNDCIVELDSQIDGMSQRIADLQLKNKSLTKQLHAAQLEHRDLKITNEAAATRVRQILRQLKESV